MIEHKVEIAYSPPDVKYLDQLAQEGWRLVSVTRSYNVRRRRAMQSIWRSFFMRDVAPQEQQAAGLPWHPVFRRHVQETRKVLDIFSVIDHLERYNDCTRQSARVEFGPRGEFCRLIIPDPKEPVAPSDPAHVPGEFKTVVDFPNPYGLIQFLAKHVGVRQ